MGTAGRDKVSGMHEQVMAVMWAAVLYLVLTAGQLMLRRVRAVHRARIPLNLLFLLLSIHTFLGDGLAHVHPGVRQCFYGALLGLAAWLLIRLVEFGLFDVVVRGHMRKQVPVVLRDIVRWLLLALALLIILRTLFPDLNLSVLAVSSIVVGYVLGNASQDTLGNLFAGLALNTERPFSISDWVQVGDYAGRVIDMTWRATRLHTKMEDHIIIPNSTIAREFIVNYSRPTLSHGFTFNVGVNYGVPPNKVRRVILQVCDAVPEVLTDPPPLVWLVGYGDFAIEYTVKFFIMDFARLESIQSRVMDLIWYYFKREGIVIPFPIRDVRMQTITPEREAGEQRDARAEVRRVVDGIELFRPLSDEERGRLAESLAEKIFAGGEVLVRQGDEGGSFFVLGDGRVKVTVRKEGRAEDVAQLAPGEFFGEMSLLTGEPRSATVTAETDTRALVLSHEVFRSILEGNNDLAGELAAVLARRRAQQQEALAHMAAHTVATSSSVQEPALLERICEFFGIGTAD